MPIAKWRVRKTTGITPSISCGYDFSAVIKSNGTLWIVNYFDDSYVDYVQIGADSDWVKCAVGTEHCVALKSDGTLWGIGWNSHGQLGQGNTTALTTITQIGSGTSWSNCFAGYFASMAIKTDGTLWACGYNANGELGFASTFYNVSTMTQVGSETDWSGAKISITGNGGHTMAVKEDGTLWATGNNNRGQFGVASPSYSYGFIQIGDLSNWKDCSAGEEHSIALNYSGEAYSAGRNLQGQLGHGDLVQRTTLTKITSSIFF